MVLKPPLSEWKIQAMLQAVAETASTISMNMQIILHGPATLNTSLTRPLFNLMSARTTDHSSYP
jgi:hypothetical protein